jgi:4-amino-4-deoxy-L-arabinose transferase-like glycosyltransferase
MGLLVLGGLIHVGFGFLLGFSVDEAHYALYATKLDFSYFDHPPLVGWIQWPLVALQAPIGVLRLIPEALWLLSSLLAWQLARDPALPVLLRMPKGVSSNAGVGPATGDQVEPAQQRELAGLWAVGLILISPVLHVLAVGLLPDTLLMALTLGLMKLTLHICQKNTIKQIRLQHWLLLGLLLGLAGLSKYTAIFSALAVTLVLLWHFGLAALKCLGLWLAMAVAMVIVTPVVYWNFTHNWISFVYQIHHGSGGDWQFKRFLLFFLIQLGAYGPLLVGASAMALWLGVRQRQAKGLAMMLFFFIPFVVTAYLAGGGGLPHWTAPAWLAASPFAARLIAQDWANGRRRFIKLLVVVQALVCSLAFTLLFFGGLPGVTAQDKWGKQNPFADLWGWDQAGSVARDLAVKLDVAGISISNWTLASRMAWYAQPLAIYVLDDRFDQFDIWFGQIPRNSDTIFVNWSQMKFDLPLKSGQFKSCDFIETLPIARAGREISTFDFYHCKSWGGRP